MPSIFFLAAVMILACGSAADVCRAEVTEGDFLGRYNLAEFFHDIPASRTEMETAAGFVSFSESGGTYEYTVTLEAASGTTDNASGEYSIDTQGRLLIDGNLSHAAISRDAGVVFLPDLDSADDDLGLSFMARQNTELEVSDLEGRYNVVEFYHSHEAQDSGDEILVGAGRLQFDSDLQEVQWQDEANSQGWTLQSGSNTYGLDDNDRLTIDGSDAFAPVSADANLVIVPDMDSDDGDVGLSLAVKASDSLGAADLFGRYHMVGFYHDDPSGADTDELDTVSGYVNFDGAGQWRSKTLISGQDGAVEETDGGDYGIDDNGRLVIDGQNTYGAVSPEGSIVVLPDMDPDEGGDVGISFLVRAPLPAADVSSSDATMDSSTSTVIAGNDWKNTYNGIPDNFAPLTDIVDFSASSVTGDQAEFYFDITGLFGLPADLLMLKLKDGSEDSLQFFYATESEASDSANYTDGTMWLTDPQDSNSYLNAFAVLDPDKTYRVHFVIEVDGEYDANPNSGVIADPFVLGAGIQSTSDGSSGGGSGGTDSSGCFIHSLEK